MSRAIDRYDADLTAEDRVRELMHREQRIRSVAVRRAVGALVQPPAPHHYHACPVSPSPRHAPDALAGPGMTDNTGFCIGGIV